MSYSFRLAARALLYAPSHWQDSTYHGLCYTSWGAQASLRGQHYHVLCGVMIGTRNSSFRTTSGRSQGRSKRVNRVGNVQGALVFQPEMNGRGLGKWVCDTISLGGLTVPCPWARGSCYICSRSLPVWISQWEDNCDRPTTEIRRICYHVYLISVIISDTI